MNEHNQCEHCDGLTDFSQTAVLDALREIGQHPARYGIDASDFALDALSQATKREADLGAWSRSTALERQRFARECQTPLSSALLFGNSPASDLSDAEARAEQWERDAKTNGEMYRDEYARHQQTKARVRELEGALRLALSYFQQELSRTLGNRNDAP